jgi:hypothetical protein
MSQQELLIRVAQTLDELGIEYMVTGSVASSLQGEPRSTHDLDVVVAIQESAAATLVRAFPSPRFYLDEESIIEAIDAHSMFNLIDTTTGDKVDFWLLTDDPFDTSRFPRRYSEEVFGARISFSRPEDTILMKLRWSILSGGSEKQFIDALGVYEVQFKNLDLNYLRTWAGKLDMMPLLRRLEGEADVL